jgi:ADP-heptose:LPS heptosyltransferase
MNILIFRTGQLGDTLVSLPAIRRIKEAYPEASLYLLYAHHTGKKYVAPPALLEGAHLFSGFIEYPVGESLTGRLKALADRVRLIFKLRSYRFHKVFHLEPSYKTPLQLRRDKAFFRLAGVSEQVTTLQYRSPVDSKRPLAAQEHETDFFIRALSSQGIPIFERSDNPMDLGLGAEETEEVRCWLTSESALSQIKYQDGRLPLNAIGVGLGSKMQSKRWPLERYRDVLRRLIEDHELVPVFFGGEEDRSIADQMMTDLGCGLNACGRLSLRGAARALEECQLYLGNDTGTMHLAVAAGIPCVAIFSARDYPGKWYPYGEYHRVHRVAVDCEGCMLLECHEQGRKCLMAISPDQVYASCVETLQITDE